jgi:uncharacterized protein involved in response to NO
MSMATPLSSKPQGGIPRGLDTTGPALLSYGFRPFFLAGGIFAVLAMLAWIGALTLGWELGGASYGALAWHAHEMIFGYAVAALAGYMLTAIPNWTGRLPVSGIPLLRLVVLWAAGRIAMLNPDLGGLYAAAFLDAIFLPALATIAAREIIAGRNWKNLKILVGLTALALLNIAFHAMVLMGVDLAVVMRGGVAIFVALVGLVGGRIIPSFTRNWLVKNGSGVVPAPFGRLDAIAMIALVGALLLWVTLPEFIGTAGAALMAAALHLVRLARWRGLRSLEEPLLLILHVGYAFVPLGLVGVALSALVWMSAPSALHILTVGVIGVMTLAIMSRATLGHTGRALTASPITSLSYFALVLATVIRPFAELLPEHYHLVLAVSGTGWIVAFALFVLEYAPMLVSPRVEKKSASVMRAEPKPV